MMREEETAEMNQLIKRIKRIYHIIITRFSGGDFDKALKYVEKGEELIKFFQGELPEEIKVLHTSWLWFKAIIYAFRGDLALSFKEANELLRVGQLNDNKRGISEGTFALGQYYMLSGDLDKALVHCDRAIRLREENLNDLWDFIVLATQLHQATRLSVVKEDLERANKF